MKIFITLAVKAITQFSPHLSSIVYIADANKPLYHFQKKIKMLMTSYSNFKQWFYLQNTGNILTKKNT